MNIARLFHVLVIGGSILGASSCSSEDDKGEGDVT